MIHPTVSGGDRLNDLESPFSGQSRALEPRLSRTCILATPISKFQHKKVADACERLLTVSRVSTFRLRCSNRRVTT